jgi:hypothetical protein
VPHTGKDADNMPRPLVLLALLFVPFATAADQTPVEKQLAIQKAMLAARQHLDGNNPAEAVAALEAQIANADGSKAFLTLLREAYQAELTQLEKAGTQDGPRAALVRRHLALLGGTPAAPPAPVAMTPLPPPSFDPPPAVPTAAGADSVAEATAEFNKRNYAAAAKLFAAHAATLTADQKAAWAYCRVRVANDTVNAAACDAATAAALAADVADALKLVPQNAELQKVGRQVIATAAAKANGRREPAGTPTGADLVETASFRVRYSGNRELAEGVAKAAESLRKEIFERWSGPPSGAWGVKCEIVIHPTAEAFAKATGRPAAGTGNAVVRLADGRAEERRIDLRADDAMLSTNALPRELTHVVLADLFPDKPAPKWAVEGMAILAGSPDEAGRYTRTLGRCARDGEWLALAQLMEMKDFPKDKVTAFYCESVALTEYLVRAAGGERNFTVFLRDCQRYGSPQALKRQFNIDGPQALEAAVKRAAMEPGR